jgi:hypothetical protein
MSRRIFTVAWVALSVALVGSAVAWSERTHQGRITSVTADELVIVDMQTGGPKTFSVPSETKIFLDSKPAKLVNLEMGFLAEIMTSQQGEKLVAKQIHAFSKRSP